MAESDAELAERLAAAAGAILLDLRGKGDLDGKALGQAGDEAANAMLCREIRAVRPDDALLSEEEKDNVARCGQSRVWIVDPLDGTREYGEGRDDWAVHVALAVDGVASVGAVALPGLGLTLTSAAPAPLQPANTPLKMLVSRTRPAAEAVFVAERIGAELLAMGSAGAKAMAVVRGEADIYLHTGGQYEWDNCAPVAVAQAAGLHVSRVDGSPLRYNNADTYLPDLLICRKELAAEVLRLAAQYSPG
ncbi:3'(2'),5'-bisphosphate nucleotidase CysQ [Sphingopyxis sp. H038]|uniref:3'(2'),5'-bisphosphate nucleotidase CysQ n=1 Tax=unclassified Sphingopyxis TaxID=2614943 RepID=UPI000731757E|nr:MULTISPECIES: 3'(2'),5'-bisphosphate nucleotidase CysQ [unclassified Sphingopyxis]KTE02042.1 3'(2'),5'-bisphosphate nucleotidase CysQ [Sphingopyxis sp. H012]KTE09791.1 3'(2'),5'-bisphosphate nucleotidase CysQ [Sphingopyxis sp. H053]KTE15185.1 3'(2'),5'-bisphosphate nucleotidase CysQ [Sphingopyxis sp. H093]KTE29892.1 3'(2'),5'-bisphosphate nucleotidase CysQ [Sphingopyxis sp. H080]KTE32878.1 3'(2'),5'-bisphosphate nucleotidase CysQ [Sphingopyxis sp. H038]